MFKSHIGASGHKFGFEFIAHEKPLIVTTTRATSGTCEFLSLYYSQSVVNSMFGIASLPTAIIIRIYCRNAACGFLPKDR